MVRGLRGPAGGRCTACRGRRHLGQGGCGPHLRTALALEKQERDDARGEVVGVQGVHDGGGRGLDDLHARDDGGHCKDQGSVASALVDELPKLSRGGGVVEVGGGVGERTVIAIRYGGELCS